MTRRQIILPIALFVLASAVFANSLRHDFVWDDEVVLVRNPHLTESGRWWKPFLRDFGEELTRRPEGYYRPLVFVGFVLNQVLGGLSPFVYHLTNVLLHGLNTVLVFWLVAPLAGRRVGAIAAALFAVHPIHAESVAFVAGRSDLQCMFFVMLAVLATRGSLTGRTPAVRFAAGAAAVLAYAAALLSKELAIALPAVLLAYGLLQRYRFRNLVWLCGPTAAVAMLYLALRLAFMPPAGLNESAGEALPNPVLRGIWLLSIYAMQQALPVIPTLGAEVLNFAGWINAMAVVLVVMLLVVARPRPLAVVALAWMVLFLAPALWVNLTKGIEPSDRFSYVPSLGICVVAALAANRFWGRTTAVRLGTAGVLIALAALSVVYSAMWRNETRLWQATVIYHPECGRSYYNLGNAYRVQGDPTRAVQAYRTASKLVEDEELRFRTLANLATVLAATGLEGLALEYCEAAVALRPAEPALLRLHGNLLAQKGQLDEAVAALGEAWRLAPQTAELGHDLARTYLKYDPPRVEEAAKAYRRSLDSGAPADPEIEARL